MLIALLSDIHANDLALEACLAEAEALGAGQLVFLGDLVGYGPEPEGVVQRIADLTAAGAITIMGNHDAAVAEDDPLMNSAAAEAIHWTRGRLSDRSKEFLASLPMTAKLEDLLFVHAEAAAPAEWDYVTGIRSAWRSLKATRARVTFCGHVHVPQVYCLGARSNMTNLSTMVESGVTLIAERRWLVVVGSVGQPRDGKTAAAFATYHTETRVMKGRRVAYDVGAVAERIRGAGLPGRLPGRLAERLVVGR